MGHIVRTPEGSYRANWRDETGRQKAKSFRTRKEAAGFMAQVEATIHQGLYVDPHAGRQSFGPYAERWLAARATEKTTAARDASIMRANVLPRWGSVPIGKIDHLAVQTWVSELAQRRSPATVRECFRILSGVVRSAVRDRIIAVSPCEGVRLPKLRRKDSDGKIITPAVLGSSLLPAVPERHRALVGLAGGTGLRWGECLGLRWDAIDLEEGTVHVLRVAVEVSGHVSIKAYPKSRAGRRSVPLPPFVVQLLIEHRRQRSIDDENGEPATTPSVFANSAGGHLGRGHFRSRVWRPALVRAGLLGEAIESGPHRYKASWPDASGVVWSADFATERECVTHVASKAAGGLRFHDLRHSYATWLVSRGLPVNDVQRVMGHENAATTLGLYTYPSGRANERVRNAFADDLLIPGEW